MAAKIGKDKEVHVTYEDQQQINKFARVNSRLQDIKDELESKKKDLQNLEDAADDLMMAEDDAVLIPYQVGEVFVHCSMDDTNKMLEEAKHSTNGEISKLEENAVDLRKILSELKVNLYAKFGNNINLEAEEEG